MSDQKEKGIIEKLGITPGPWFDENQTPPIRKYYGMRSCGSYSKEIFSISETWSTNSETEHNGAEMEANKKMLIATPEMLEALIEIVSKFQSIVPANTKYVKQYQDEFLKNYDIQIKAIQKATGKSWEEIKALL